MIIDFYGIRKIVLDFQKTRKNSSTYEQIKNVTEMEEQRH